MRFCVVTRRNEEHASFFVSAICEDDARAAVNLYTDKTEGYGPGFTTDNVIVEEEPSIEVSSLGGVFIKQGSNRMVQLGSIEEGRR